VLLLVRFGRRALKLGLQLVSFDQRVLHLLLQALQSGDLSLVDALIRGFHLSRPELTYRLLPMGGGPLQSSRDVL